MTDDQSRSSEDTVRGPAVPVKDADILEHEPGRRVHHHFPREMSGQPDIVVAEHHLRCDPVSEESREEVEEDGAQRRRCADDRMLHIARDHDAASLL
jgi:hypothetical protein